MKQLCLLLSVMFLTLTTASGAAIVVSDTNVAAALTTFRANIGGGANNANTAGTQLAGHREINWDATIVPFVLPGTFFNSPPTTRGVVMTTAGTGFNVSETDFSEIDPSYPATFNAFSPSKTFAATGSNVVDVAFRVPGAATIATVTGFGVVFSDIDLSASTSLQFFTPGGASLGTFFASPNNGGFSFLGVSFNAGELVGSVRITSGTAALATGVTDLSLPGLDLVVMDDFLYSEPQAVVPEPLTFALSGAGLGAIALLRRSRRRG